MEELLEQLVRDPAKVDSIIMTEVVQRLAQQKPSADSLVSMPILQRVHQSRDRNRSWFKYEIFLTKVLVAQVVTTEEFESAVLPLLKQDMDRVFLHKLGSCIKGTVTSYCKGRSDGGRDQCVQLMEWIGWLCSPAADF